MLLLLLQLHLLPGGEAALAIRGCQAGPRRRQHGRWLLLLQVLVLVILVLVDVVVWLLLLLVVHAAGRNTRGGSYKMLLRRYAEITRPNCGQRRRRRSSSLRSGSEWSSVHQRPGGRVRRLNRQLPLVVLVLV
jgi:hypothetical protein